MPTRQIEIRNGMRQPQARNAAGTHRVLHQQNHGQRQNSPSVAVIWMKLV